MTDSFSDESTLCTVPEVQYSLSMSLTAGSTVVKDTLVNVTCAPGTCSVGQGSLIFNFFVLAHSKLSDGLSIE